MRAMSGQSTPRPKALVAIISRKIICVLQKSVKTISCISGVVAAVNILIKRNSTMFGNPGGSVMFPPTASLICHMFHHILVAYSKTKLFRNFSYRVNSSSAKLVQISVCEIVAPKMYLMLDRLTSSPMIVVSFIDNRSMTQSTVPCVAVTVNANIWADLGKMLLKVPICEKALRNASSL